MRIGFVSTMEHGVWGASEELWSQAALRLIRQGEAVGANIVRHAEIAPRIAELEIEGCRITRRFGSQTLLTRASRRLIGDQSLRWLAEFRPDLAVISQGDHLSGWPWMAECARLGIPYVTITHLVVTSEWPIDSRRDEIACAYAQAKINLFVSEANREQVRRQLAHPLPHGEVVRAPFNVRYDASPSWPGDGPAWKLACIARLEPLSKGQDVLFDVLRQEKWRTRPLQLTLFGDGPCREGLLALKEMYGLDNVHFAGVSNNIEAVWAAHHALILPSRNEGLPAVLVEAMLCGRPCITIDVGGNAELVEDGVTGFIAPAPQVRWLDDAMERAWEAREHWRAMGEAAARRVRELVPSDPIGVFIERLMEVEAGNKA